MIAFYAVSNLAIVNAINVKGTYFPQEKTDLYVRYVGGTDLDLVEKAMQSEIFENVYMINMPTINKKKGILGKIPYVRSLFYGKKNQSFVNHYLDILHGDKIYDKMFTLHMDAHAVYFANYFKKRNKRIEICFYEDGNASYLCTKKYLTHSIQSTLSRKAFWAKKIAEAPYYFQVRKNITDKLYIYCADQYNPSKGFRPFPVEVQPDCLHLLQGMGQAVPVEIRLRYQKKMVYYIANPKTKAEPTYDFSYEIIERISKVVGDRQMIIKPHANASTENRNLFGAKYEEKIYVDRNTYFLEGLLSTLSGMDQKIIVSRASAAAMLPKIWLKKEPYILLTLRLFPFYGESGDPGGDEFIELLRSVYSDPSRIMVPNTLGEMELMLKQCVAHIYEEVDRNRGE